MMLIGQIVVVLVAAAAIAGGAGGLMYMIVLAAREEHAARRHMRANTLARRFKASQKVTRPETRPALAYRAGHAET